MSQLRIRQLMAGLLLLVFQAVAVARTERPLHNVLDYGAVADSAKVSTAAIQAAIDSCYFQGGGTVYFPPGDYCSGTIVLKENVTLFMEAGATLYASKNIQDYRIPLEGAVMPVLLYANGARNISLAGTGQINGDARHTYEPLRKVDRFIKDLTENARLSGVEMKRYYIVPPNVALLLFMDCEDVHMQDLTLTNSTFWTMNLMRCSRVTIQGMQVLSSLEKGVNSDGMDINSCQDVMISDCYVSTGDDAIVLKTYFSEPTQNVVVTNCVLSSSSTALKLGTESHGNFRHIRFNNCIIRNTNRGLSVVVRNAGHVEDVVFSNITMTCSRRHFNWWGDADPIWIKLTTRYSDQEWGSISNVRFENIVAFGMGTSKIEADSGMSIKGVSLRNVEFNMRPEDYPDKRADHAFYAENVSDLELHDVSVNWTEDAVEEKWKSALVFSDVRGLTIDAFRGRQGLLNSKEPVVKMDNVQDVLIRDSEPTGPVSTLFHLSGVQSQRVRLINNDLFQQAKQVLQLAPDVKSQTTIKKLD